MTSVAAPVIGTAFPFLFTYKDTLFGNGFVVEVVATNGRALCVREEDAFWMYGVNPGGMAAHGHDVEAAHAEFRTTFSHVLVDIARESANFEAFRSSVQAFFDETNAGYEADWHAAVERVRGGGVALESVLRLPANSPRRLEISTKQLAVVKAEDNKAELEATLAA